MLTFILFNNLPMFTSKQKFTGWTVNYTAFWSIVSCVIFNNYVDKKRWVGDQ